MNNQSNKLSRLDRILQKLAQKYKPELLTNFWTEKDEVKRIHRIARQLASEGVVVVAGRVPDQYRYNRQLKEQVVGQWIRPYRKLYEMLTMRLFPNMANLHQFYAQYADVLDPPIIILSGEATAVWHWVAGSINPYLDSRQSQQSATRAELYGLMSMILDALQVEVGRLRSELIEEGIGFLEEMLSSSVDHISLTTFDPEVVPLLGPDTRRTTQTNPVKPPPASMPGNILHQTQTQPAPPPVPHPTNNHTPPGQLPFDLDYIEDEEPPASTLMFRQNVNTETGILPPLPPLPPMPNPDDKNKKNGRK